MFIPQRFANNLGVIFTVLVTAIVLSCTGCNGTGGSNDPADTIAQGRDLAKRYCANCHLYPQPALLDKATWEKGVLPNMAIKLGIQREMGMYYADHQSVINVTDWQKIISFYKAMAPQTLQQPKHNAVKDWGLFSLIKPAKAAKGGQPAMTTMIRFNPFDKHIYTGDMSNNLLKWDGRLNATLVKEMPSAVTAANFYQSAGLNKAIFTCIGVLPPNDYLKGTLEDINLTNASSTKTITDSLPRPVQTASADFNKDGLTDYVVCGYGNTKGGLFMVQQQPNKSFIKKVIRAVPGAIQVETGDYNSDGWPDIMCLFAQSDEGIWLFLNDQKGGFATRNLLRFPPVYGSNSFQLADMNGDGKKDIIYTCGDNNDYSSVLKPYHGMYIFTNQGNFKFKQSYFYHINGCSKAMVADFNSDGKMDIATIAFFADFKYHPTEGFIYLQQAGANKFNPHEVPVNKYGRWIAMEVADVDGDGDEDIVLGNFSVFQDKLINQKGFKPNWDMHEPIVLLKNNTVKH
jgi:hypothetical protein